jgi:hypothetical protein
MTVLGICGNNSKQYNKCVTGIPKGKEKANGTEKEITINPQIW